MKKGILFLVLVLLGLLCMNYSYASELTDDYFDIATNYFNANNYPKALEYLDLIIQIEPDNLAAKTLRNKISPPVDTPEGTTKVTSTSDSAQFVVIDVPQADVEKMSYNSDYYNQKGQELYQKKEFDKAIEFFYKAIKLNKKNAQAYNNLGMAYWMKSNPDCAIKNLKKANAINKNYTQPLVNLAMLYKALNNPKDQVFYLKKAIQYNCNDYLAYFKLGEYYKDNGYYPQAIENYKEVVKINPKFSPVYMSLAISFFLKQKNLIIVFLHWDNIVRYVLILISCFIYWQKQI